MPFMDKNEKFKKDKDKLVDEEKDPKGPKIYDSLDDAPEWGPPIEDGFTTWPFPKEEKEEEVDKEAGARASIPDADVSSLQAKLDAMSAPGRVKLDTSISTRMESALNKAANLLDNAESKEEKIESQRLLEKITNAFTQLGAASFGGNTWDASNLKLPKTDFEAKLDRLSAQVNNAVETIDRAEGRRMDTQVKQANLDEGLQGRQQRYDESKFRGQSDIENLKQNTKIRQAEFQQREDLSDAKLKQKSQSDLMKAAAKAAAGSSPKEIAKVLKDARSILVRDIDEDQKIGAFRQILEEQGITGEVVENIIDPAGWSDNTPEAIIVRATRALRDQALQGGGAPTKAPGLEIGTERNGYRYIGGDAADQNSWERI